MICSMIRKDDCWDNIVVEGPFDSLKTKWIADIIYRTRDEARTDEINYIEMFYNSDRLHSFWGYKNPNASENNFTLGKVA
ncbi:MAG: IS3 family transposase [Desulfobacteraceae bacterium]|nr:IS3 family transposase [Desulfobacteraceae bacterium]